MTLVFIIGLAILLGLVLLLVREVRRSPGPMRWGKRPVWKKRIRITLVALLLFVAALGFWAVLIEPNRLVVHPASIQIDNWPNGLSGLRIAMISDVHTGGPFINDKKLKDIVDTTNALNPDLIVLLGDYMSGNSWHGHQVAPAVTAAALKELRAPLGAYAVLGNHDWWYSGQRVRGAFEANGIRVLDDEVTEIKWRDQSFWLAGLADLWTRPQHIKETIGKVPSGLPVIAITHNPDIFANQAANSMPRSP